MVSATAQTLTLVKSQSRIENVSTFNNISSKTTDNQNAVWFCLYFPCISLSVVEQKEGIPVAVFEDIKGKQIIHAACDISMHQGVMPGMPLSAALVLCRELVIQPRNLEREENMLKKYAESMEYLTPIISLSGTNTILLEVSRSLRLFHGFDAIHNQIRHAFYSSVSKKFEPFISSAPSPVAASLLAQNGLEQVIETKSELKSILGKIRISNSEISFKIKKQLAKCGLKTLRDLWRLPRPDLTRRFGLELISYLDKACAQEHDLRVTKLPITRFFQHMELPMETNNMKLILLAAEKLLIKAEDYLRQRACAAQTMIFGLHPSQRGRLIGVNQSEIVSISIGSRQASRHANQFLGLLVEKLERINIDSVVSGVSLRVNDIVVYQSHSRSIFEVNTKCNGSECENWTELLDLLSARLGCEQIYNVSCVDDHRPEKAWVPLPTQHAGWKNIDKNPKPTPSRPFWLLKEPRKIQLSFEPPQSKVERIESGWWETQPVRRNYGEISTRYGSRYWVYEDLDDANDGIEEKREYYVHGVYG